MRQIEGIATVEELLASTTGTVTETLVLVRQVRVRIGILPQAVTIRIYYDGGHEPYSYETSHVMKTYGEVEIRRDGRGAPSEAEALRRAIRTLTEGYECAVRGGEMPEDAWLVRV